MTAATDHATPCAALPAQEQQPQKPVRRRHVFYLEGYDPQGVPGYYGLFKREFARFLQLWPVKGTLGPAETNPDGITGRWRIETEGPNWRVETTYDFLRWDDIILRDMARSGWLRPFRVFSNFLGFTVNGTAARIFNAYWRFGCFFCYPVLVLILTILLAVVVGRMTAEIASGHSGEAAAILLGLLVACVVYAVAARAAQKWFVIQLSEMWLFVRDHLRGRRPEMDLRIDAFAERIVTAIHAAEADEVVLVSHSCGGFIAPDVLARMFARDPFIADHGPRLVWMSIGSIMPAAALHPAGAHLRRELARLACDDRLTWIECQAWDDFVNVWTFDPVVRLALPLEGPRRNPLMIDVPFREVLYKQTYLRFRVNFFRMHFQFIMANDRRAAYDYFMMLCGPAPLTTWALDDAISRFGSDGAYAAPLTAPDGAAATSA